MAKRAAKERAAALKVDTDKLLKLSVELKSYVDKSDENVLSLDVIKKAEEIEKLAKSVKDKMKGPTKCRKPSAVSGALSESNVVKALEERISTALSR